MSQGGKWSQLSNSDRKKIGYSDKSFNDKWKRLSNKEALLDRCFTSFQGWIHVHSSYAEQDNLCKRSRKIAKLS